MEPRISLITLGVSDLHKSVEFYREGLGFEMSKASNENVAFFKTSGCVLGLYPIEELAKDIGGEYLSEKKSKFTGITLAHNTKEKQEVDEILLLAENAGGQIIKPGQEVFWGGYSGYFKDPDGHLWEVAWGAFPFKEDGSLELP